MAGVGRIVSVAVGVGYIEGGTVSVITGASVAVTVTVAVIIGVPVSVGVTLGVCAGVPVDVAVGVDFAAWAGLIWTMAANSMDRITRTCTQRRILCLNADTTKEWWRESKRDMTESLPDCFPLYVLPVKAKRGCYFKFC